MMANIFDEGFFHHSVAGTPEYRDSLVQMQPINPPVTLNLKPGVQLRIASVVGACGDGKVETLFIKSPWKQGADLIPINPSLVANQEAVKRIQERLQLASA